MSAELLERLRAATAGQYRIVRELGHGGMAAVYLAWDAQLARHVAVKVMYPEGTRDEGMAKRFLREAQTGASLDHPNIVRVHGARVVDELRFFAMSYVDGCSLKRLLQVTGALAC